MRLLLIALLCAACGDPIVDHTYRGDPVYTFEGQISALEDLEGRSLGSEVRASLFWSVRPESERPIVEQSSVTTSVRFPATFEVRVFETPADEHFFENDPRYALGLLLIYVDEDGDGVFGAEDRMVGGTFEQAVMFSRARIPSSDSPIGESISPGFRVVYPPLDCPVDALPPPEPEPPELMHPCGDCGPEMHCNEQGWCEPNDPFSITVDEGFELRALICI